MCVYFLISLPPPSSNNCFALSTHTVRRPQTQDAQEAFFGFGAKQVHHTWPSTLGFGRWLRPAARMNQMYSSAVINLAPCVIQIIPRPFFYTER